MVSPMSLHGVVAVDLQIAPGLHLQVESAVGRGQGEHVVQKGKPRIYGGPSPNRPGDHSTRTEVSLVFSFPAARPDRGFVL